MQSLGNGRHILGINEQSGRTRYFGQRGAVGREHRHLGVQRLQHGYPKAFEEGHVGERQRSPHQGGQFLVGHVAQEVDI